MQSMGGIRLIQEEKLSVVAGRPAESASIWIFSHRKTEKYSSGDEGNRYKIQWPQIKAQKLRLHAGSLKYGGEAKRKCEGTKGLGNLFRPLIGYMFLEKEKKR